VAYYDYDRAEMLGFVPPDVRSVLDVGCASGRFGLRLRERFPDADLWGIDRIEHPAGETNAYDQRCTGRYPDDLPARRFDCIVFNDVLEHLVDPWAALRDTRARVSSGGSVVASIPNVRHRHVVRELVVRGRWEYADRGVLDRTHLRFFTRSSMLDLFADTGYRVTRIEPLAVASGGRVGALNRWVGGRLDEFLTLQYALVARPIGS
jgi:2-polyprenyl-3-methyl-5-hydroxy-6-metoxy-1,4-benzoquinol methylase